MIRHASIPGLMVAVLALSGCESGRIYSQGVDTVIANAQDGGSDGGALNDGEAAIAYDPDGCQAWIIDDGLEGYSGRRYDPVSGLPVCNDLYPPGTVLGNYQTASPGLPDFIPR